MIAVLAHVVLVAVGLLAVRFRRAWAEDAMAFQDRLWRTDGKFTEPHHLRRTEWVYAGIGIVFLSIGLWGLVRPS
jgi:hypothetical protein